MTHPYAWVVPGAKCVCIDDDFGYVTNGRDMLPVRQPMLNEVLTIREVEIGRASNSLCSRPGEPFLYFWEIERRQSSGDLSGEVSFLVENFRPLLDRPTDISVLTSLLNPSKQTEDA